MQNLPVTAIQSVAPPQTQAPADNAPQATESFSNVLARQRASAAEGKQADSKQSQPGSKQEVASTAAPGDAPPAADSNAGQDSAQTGGLPVIGTTQADLLAALLPGTTPAEKVSASEKPSTQTDTQVAASTLPGDMLAMLLPAQIASKAVAQGAGKVAAESVQETAAGPGGKVRPLQINAGKADKPGLAQPKSGPVLPGEVQVRPQGADRGVDKGAAVVEAAGAGKEKAFAAALEASVKGAKKASALDADLAKTNPQTDTAPALGSLVSNGTTSAASGSNATAQATQAAINTPVTDAAWGNEFNQKITWMATQQQQTAELHLNPPNLGPLDVLLNVNGDQATALFTSPHAAVRDAVEQALPRLRDMMADNGIMLGNATVSDQSPRDQQAGQSSRQGSGDTAAGQADPAFGAGALPASSSIPVRRHLGMVDTFV